MRYRHLAASLGLLLALLSTSPAMAHGGEDHSHDQPTVMAGWLPRATASSEQFEVVLVADGDHAQVFLTDANTNEGIGKAQLQVDFGAKGPSLTATAGQAGWYRLDWQAPAVGEHALTVTVITEETADVLNLNLTIPAAEAGFEHAHSWQEFLPQLMWGGAALLLCGVLGWRWRQKA